jgi:hypothetical protein
METKEEIAEKIGKLLAKANQAGTKEEAATFFAGASRLMTKYGIEAHEVKDAEDKKKPVEFEVNTSLKKVWKNTRPVHFYIRQVIRQCFNVSVVKTGAEGYDIRYYFIGTRDDCHFAQYAFEVLLDTFNNLFTRYLLAEYGVADSKARSASRQHGFFAGCRDGFIEAWDEAQKSEMQKQNAQSFAIVLVDKSKALDAYIKNQTDVTFTKRKTLRIDSSAYFQGMEEGRKIKVNRALS